MFQTKKIWNNFCDNVFDGVGLAGFKILYRPNRLATFLSATDFSFFFLILCWNNGAGIFEQRGYYVFLPDFLPE